MAKSLDEMSPDELNQLGDAFKALMQEKKKDQPSLTPSNDSPSQDDSDEEDDSPSLFQMASQKYQQKSPEMASSQDNSNDESDEEDQEEQPESPKLPYKEPQKLNEALNPTDNKPSLTDQYKKAQDQSNLLTAINQLGKATSTIGSGIAGATGGGIIKPTQVDTKGFDSNISLAQQIPQQFKDQLSMQREDPQSDTSKNARNFINQTLGIKVPDNLSAAQLKEQFPVLERFLQAKETAQSRKETALLKQQELAQQKDKNDDEKKDKLLLNEIDGSTKFRGDPAGSMAATTHLNIQKALDALKDPKTGDYYTDLDKVPKPTLDMFKGELSRILSGSVGTNMTFAHSISPSLKSTIGSLQSFADPNSGALAGDQLKLAKDYLQTIDKDVVDHLNKKLAAKQKAISTVLGPERAATFKKYTEDAWGFSPSDESDKHVTSQQSAPKGNVTADTLNQYSQKHGLSKDQAAKLLKDGGYQVEGY